MLGFYKRMTKSEIEAYLKGKGNHRVHIGSDNKVWLTDSDSGFGSLITRDWRLDETGQPTDPRRLLRYNRYHEFSWLGDLKELNANFYTIGFGIFGKSGFDYVEPDCATHVALTCYYMYEDYKNDDGIKVECHPGLIIEDEFQYDVSIGDWDNYDQPYNEYTVYIIALPETLDATEFCLSQASKHKRCDLDNFRKLRAYKKRIQDERPKFETLKALIESSAKSEEFTLELEEYRVKLIPKGKKAQAYQTKAYLYASDQVTQIIDDME